MAVDVPDTQTLASVPPWIAITVLALGAGVPILTTLLSRIKRRDSDPDEPPEPPQPNPEHVDAVQAALDRYIEDLTRQRDRLEAEVDEVRDERDQLQRDIGARDAEIARLKARQDWRRREAR